MRRILCLLAACAHPVAGDDDQALVDALGVRPIATLPSANVRGLAIAPLDEQRIALAGIEHTGDAFCPDCVDLDPAECPSLCTRSRVWVQTVGAPAQIDVATVFPVDYDHSVDQVEVVALGADRVGVAWLDCDNAACLGMFAKRSCTARYATVDLAAGSVGAPQTLYTGWFGDLSLAFDTTSRQLLAVVAKDLAFGTGMFRAIFDETGATTLSPWAALGSTAARSPALLPGNGEFLVVADDWSPSRPALASPCTQSCDCLAAGSIDLEQGGLFAFHVGTGGDASERVASGRDARGFYARREQLAVIDAGGRPMIAATQSIDRVAEIFTHDGEAWQLVLSTPAPIPLWIGALGTADHAAWLGAQPESGASATVQRLVAGIAAGDASERAAFDEPLDRSVFVAAPVATARGVTSNVLLQGIFRRDGMTLTWDHFDLFAVDASW